MATPFPFAQYFGDINILAALQFAPGEKQFADRPPADPQAKELLHLAKTAIAVLGRRR